MEKLRDVTLVFLVDRSEGKVKRVCLAMKKRGFGKDRWNGTGGKVKENDETIEESARRETKEEIGVLIKGLEKVAVLSFRFPHNSDFNQMVHVYFSGSWEGEPEESEEMAPKWFSSDEVPYEEMWPDDRYWFPYVLDGKKVKASFVFGEGDVIKEKDVVVVEDFL